MKQQSWCIRVFTWNAAELPITHEDARQGTAAPPSTQGDVQHGHRLCADWL